MPPKNAPKAVVNKASAAASIVKQMKTRTQKVSTALPENLLSTGSTLLDLACSGRLAGGLEKGKYYLLVGDSSSGKTFLSLTCFAESTINENFKDYRLIFDNLEDGASMDFEFFFGKKVAEKVEAPAYNKAGEPVYSTTVESFYDNLYANLDLGPCVYVLDSENALTSEGDIKAYEAQRKARKKKSSGEEDAKDAAGSYGMFKAKVHANKLNMAISKMKENGSILIMISQTRDNPQAKGPFQDKKTRSGGKALKFYATLEFWTEVKGQIKKRVKDKERNIGVFSQIKIKKNRTSGRIRTVVVPIINTVGIDDLGGCIDYLLEEGHWKKEKGIINAKELDFTGNREQIIKYVEDENEELTLRTTVLNVWNDIEAALRVERKSRYDTEE